MSNIDVNKIIKAKIVDFVHADLGFPKNGDESIQVKSGLLAEDIIDSVRSDADDLAFKELGECEICRGKGYSPINTLHVKYSGEERIVTHPTRLRYRFCSCERGQALKHLVINNRFLAEG